MDKNKIEVFNLQNKKSYFERNLKEYVDTYILSVVGSDVK